LNEFGKFFLSARHDHGSPFILFGSLLSGNCDSQKKYFETVKSEAIESVFLEATQVIALRDLQDDSVRRQGWV